VEHPCHKCGAGVEDGTPFCKQCGAPQIRVVGVETETPPAPDISDSNESLPVVPPLTLPAVSSTGVQWSHALPGAALGGAFSLLLTGVPLAVLGPAFMAGGILAVRCYRRHLKGGVPSPRTGAQIGAASGGFGFLFSAILKVAEVMYHPDELRRQTLDTITFLIGHGIDPQIFQPLQESLKTAEGLTSSVLLGLLPLLVFAVAGASIGGALYAAWLRKRALQ
jgi:hypothetical protein